MGRFILQLINRYHKNNYYNHEKYKKDNIIAFKSIPMLPVLSFLTYMVNGVLFFVHIIFIYTKKKCLM